MEEVTITKREWDALKSMRESDKIEIIGAVFATAFDGEEPEFDEWRKDEKLAIFNLLKK